jgi:hypothetical protein
MAKELDIDPRLTRLSHSGRTMLHRCPRKYQLSKISRAPIDAPANVTLVFGTVVGLGIQCVLEGKTWTATVMEMFLAWSIPDIYAEEEKSQKSFFTAIFAVQSFTGIQRTLLDDYELAYFEGKPAVELSFRITLMDNFTYRGFVDVVLKHKITGKLLVLEVKTTGAKYVSAATFKNSGQALGYSLVLDAIAPHESEYEVWYLIYMTTMKKFEILPFRKHYSDRAFWIQELIMDVDRIKYYEEQDNYPSYGESCYDFFRECEFLSNCTMSTSLLAIPYDAQEMVDKMDREGEVGYTFELSLLDIVNAQLDRKDI